MNHHSVAASLLFFSFCLKVLSGIHFHSFARPRTYFIRSRQMHSCFGVEGTRSLLTQRSSGKGSGVPKENPARSPQAFCHNQTRRGGVCDPYSVMLLLEGWHWPPNHTLCHRSARVFYERRRHDERQWGRATLDPATPNPEIWTGDCVRIPTNLQNFIQIR